MKEGLSGRCKVGGPCPAQCLSFHWASIHSGQGLCHVQLIGGKQEDKDPVLGYVSVSRGSLLGTWPVGCCAHCSVIVYLCHISAVGGRQGQSSLRAVLCPLGH